jgi:hypothetical protein
LQLNSLFKIPISYASSNIVKTNSNFEIFGAIIKIF